MAERMEAINTRWSIIRMSAGDKPETVEARKWLVLRYATAIRKYIGAMLRQDDDADELAQDVVMRLMRGDFAGADASKGRFRDFLKTAVRNMVQNHWAKQKRSKTEMLAIDPGTQKEEERREQVWQGACQKTLLEHAMARCRELLGTDSPAIKMLKLRTDFPDASSEELAEKLGQTTGTTIRADAGRQLLRRARVSFAEALMEEVKSGIDSINPEAVKEELAGLGLLAYVEDFVKGEKD